MSAASRTTSSCPSVYDRKAGGMRTRTPLRAISSGEASVAVILPASASATGGKAFGPGHRIEVVPGGIIRGSSFGTLDGHAGNP